MNAIWKKISNVLSWVFLICMVGLLIFTTLTTIQSKKTGESAYLFGYRPILVLTGSMEPYMMTNSVALTKQVSDMDQLEVGDVVTYHLTTEEGRFIRITHRIISIDNGLIRTKGDNNRVEDGYMLTIDNIESEVIAVFNQTAWLALKWQTTVGKVMIISFTLALIFLYYALKAFIRERFSKTALNEKASEVPSEAPAVPIQTTQESSDPAEAPPTDQSGPEST